MRHRRLTLSITWHQCIVANWKLPQARHRNSRLSDLFKHEDGDIEAQFVRIHFEAVSSNPMFKMRLGWYAGVSTALAGAVVISAFHQRANFYSAMVYLAQSNFCLLVLVNFILLLYSSFIYGLTQLCYGTLRAIEIEQLTERAWFAITETCLAMTIFREEIGAWFLVMFTALVTGKVWGWIGDGRVEFLEQQPPSNPRLFHTRLSISLAMSFLYDVWILRYTINTVIQQARPNMMVMFLFEFAVLATCSWRTGARYILSLAEQNIVKTQTKKRLLERKEEVKQQREDMIRQREQAAAAGEEAPNSHEPLPDPDDIDEMDIEVPGWATKGEWVLWLDLLTDMIKLGIYVAFFLMLLMFYGLPIHIMRDLFMTTRDFLKRLNALLRYRRAIQEMNKYPDATEQDLANENTCIICREEMYHWDPNRNSVDRVRPKKLPCGHILHLGCLKSWLERQQVCPTCRSPVTGDQVRPQQGPRAAGLRIQIGGLQQPQAQRAPANNDNNNNNNNNAQRGDAGQQGAAQNQGGGGHPRVFTFGPLRVGFGAGGQQVRELAQQFGIPQPDVNPLQASSSTAASNTQSQQPSSSVDTQSIRGHIQQAEQMLQQELQALHASQQELQIINIMMSELNRIRQRRQAPADNVPGGLSHPTQPFNQNQQIPLSIQPQTSPPIGLPPFQPAFPGIPPRISSPFMTRHGATGYSTTISAGSPDLPDGVVLPPGWSLMPLQRLDGAAGLSQPPLQTGNVPPSGESTSANQPSVSSIQPTPTSGVSHEVPLGDSAPLIPGLGDTPRSRLSTVPRPPQTAYEPPPVVSPSPVTINWASSGSLLSNSNGRLERMERAPQPIPPQADIPHPTEERSLTPEFPTSESAVETAVTNSESSSAAQSEQREEGTARTQKVTASRLEEETKRSQEEPFDKGKGKAVTVEEADEED